MRKLLARAAVRLAKALPGTVTPDGRERQPTGQPEGRTVPSTVPQWESRPLVTRNLPPMAGPVELPGGAQVYEFPQAKDEVAQSHPRE